MKFKMNNREWTITEVSQQAIKNMQNIRKANEEENLKSIDMRYYGITYCDTLKIYIDEELLIPNNIITGILFTVIAIIAMNEYLKAISKVCKPIKCIAYLSCIIVAIINLIPE